MRFFRILASAAIAAALLFTLLALADTGAPPDLGGLIALVAASSPSVRITVALISFAASIFCRRRTPARPGAASTRSSSEPGRRVAGDRREQLHARGQRRRRQDQQRPCGDRGGQADGLRRR
jgi:hypothetical protein